MLSPIQVSAGVVFAGDFRIVRELGRGGMGTVYVAHQLSTGRDRALKLMHPLLSSDADLRRRFEQEARVGSRIRSEHVVDVVAAGIDQDSGMPWLAMELLEGEDLATLVARTGPLPIERCAALVAQIGHALAAAHAANIVHRDLKPENVFLALTHREGDPITVKLLDFGIAKIIAPEATGTASLGTPLWMAPEQAGGTVGPQADVWSLGLMVFWMLTGRCYWRAAARETAPAPLAILQEIVGEAFEPASVRARALGFAGDLPPGFDAWFSRCAVRDPAQRFPDAGAAREAFARLVSGAERTSEASAVDPRAATMPHVPAPANTTAKVRRGSRVGALVALAAACLTVAVIAAVRPKQRQGATATTTMSVSTLPARSAEAPTVAAADNGPVDKNTLWNVPLGASPQRGPADALVTIVEFGNYQCPFSKTLEETIAALLKEHPNDLRLVWKDNPIAVHSLAGGAAQLTRELRVRKGDEAFWQAHDRLLLSEVEPEPAALADLGLKLGLSRADVDAALEQRRHTTGIEEDLQLADDYAVNGTPAFFVNGRYLAPTADGSELRALVLAELESARQMLARGVPRAKVLEAITSRGHRGLPLEIRKADLTAPLYIGYGAPAPKVLLVEFCSYDALLCQLIAPAITDLLERHKDILGFMWIDTPDLKSAGSKKAGVLSFLAFQQLGKQGFVRANGRLLAAQDEDDGFSDKSLLRIAKEIGLDRTVVAAGLKDLSLHNQLAANVETARKVGVDLNQLPGFLICKAADQCRGGGYYLSAAQAVRAFEKRIRLVLETGAGPLPTVAH